MLRGVQGRAKNSGAADEKKEKNKRKPKAVETLEGGFLCTSYPSSSLCRLKPVYSVAATLPGRLPLQSVLRSNGCLKRLWLA
jgi:hypothetical protein